MKLPYEIFMVTLLNNLEEERRLSVHEIKMNFSSIRNRPVEVSRNRTVEDSYSEKVGSRFRANKSQWMRQLYIFNLEDSAVDGEP
jgi:hypothetical protein